LLDDQIVPQTVPPILLTADQVQVQALDLIHPLGKVPDGRQGLTRRPKPVRMPGVAPADWQSQQSPVLQFVQGHLGTGKAQPSMGRTPMQVLADLTSQNCVRDMQLVSQHFVQMLDQSGPKRMPAKLYRRLHGR
jgi:hypothetical protein